MGEFFLGEFKSVDRSQFGGVVLPYFPSSVMGSQNFSQ